MTKICNKCLLDLDEVNFSKKKLSPDGLQGQCKNCAAKMQKEWRKNNPEKSKKSVKTWAKNNKEKLNYYDRKRRENNPHYLILNRLRKRLSDALSGTKKTDSTMSLLGCSKQELVQHLEDQFTQGMSWDKMGVQGIHIDHIIPCASFDLTDPEQQRQCFHYTNLQPLWAKDNLRKGDKMPHELSTTKRC
jgi:hypothetical protein